MNSTVTALLLASALMLATAVLLSRLPDLRRSYYLGIALWSRWLPVCAIGVFIAVVGINLLNGGHVRGALGTAGYFSTLDLAVLFVVGPLFLTRMGNVLASATVLYLLGRLITGSQELATPVSLYFLTGAATVVALLADKMPWLHRAPPHGLVNKFREMVLTFITVAAMGIVFAAILKVNGLSRWLTTMLAVSLPPTAILGILAAIFFGWLSVALGFTRHFTMPLLCLPSILILAFVTGWPSYLLVIPFMACVALSLASAERRLDGRRRGGGYGATFLLG